MTILGTRDGAWRGRQTAGRAILRRQIAAGDSYRDTGPMRGGARRLGRGAAGRHRARPGTALIAWGTASPTMEAQGTTRWRYAPFPPRARRGPVSRVTCVVGDTQRRPGGREKRFGAGLLQRQTYAHDSRRLEAGVVGGDPHRPRRTPARPARPQSALRCHATAVAGPRRCLSPSWGAPLKSRLSVAGACVVVHYNARAGRHVSICSLPCDFNRRLPFTRRTLYQAYASGAGLPWPLPGPGKISSRRSSVSSESLTSSTCR